MTKTMLRSAFLGTGHYVPEHVVTNAMLAQRMETSDDWIVQRTGIRERRHVDFDKEPMGASEMGARAARRALEAAGLRADDIDLIVYATLSPDKQFPGDGVLVGAKLDVPVGVPALDVRNQCSGFLYSLSVADAFIRAGVYKRVLVIGSECHSTGLDFSTRGRDVAVLFGDGAAAAVLGPAEKPGEGVLSVHLHADGRHAEELHLSVPSSAHLPRLNAAMLEADQYPQMNGRSVFKHAVTRMPEVVLEALEHNRLSTADIGLLICHQANLRISEAVQKRLELPDERVFNNIEHYGNTTAASIPLCIDEAVRSGRLKKGQLLALASFGAGFTWAAALIRW
jgi:3-oxoacyl-[acyl-carrier-protein] synthase-3